MPKFDFSDDRDDIDPVAEAHKAANAARGRIKFFMNAMSTGDDPSKIANQLTRLADIVQAYCEHGEQILDRPDRRTTPDRGRTSSDKKDEPKPAEAKKDEPKKPADGPRARRLLRGKAA